MTAAATLTTRSAGPIRRAVTEEGGGRRFSSKRASRSAEPDTRTHPARIGAGDRRSAAREASANMREAVRNLCRSWVGAPAKGETDRSARRRRGVVPQVSLLEERALLSAFAGHGRAAHAAHVASLHRERGAHGPLSGRSSR